MVQGASSTDTLMCAMSFLKQQGIQVKTEDDLKELVQALYICTRNLSCLLS